MNPFKKCLRQRTAAAVQRCAQKQATQPQSALGLVAYHGTKKRNIKQFSLKKIGTGQGAQAFGWGLYFAERKAIAESYRPSPNERTNVKLLKQLPSTRATCVRKKLRISSYILSGAKSLDRAAVLKRAKRVATTSINFEKKVCNRKGRWLAPAARAKVRARCVAAIPKHSGCAIEVLNLKQKDITVAQRQGAEGQTYKVTVPDPDALLDYDKPLTRQPKAVKQVLPLVQKRLGASTKTKTGSDLYNALSKKLRGDKRASLFLNKLGIPGLQFLDGRSRSKRTGTHNVVVWDEKAVKVTGTLHGF